MELNSEIFVTTMRDNARSFNEVICDPRTSSLAVVKFVKEGKTAVCHLLAIILKKIFVKRHKHRSKRRVHQGLA